MKTACRFGWLLVLLAVLLVAPSAAKLNTQYLIPSGSIHIDQSQLSQPALKICALTFDDGPDARYTLQVLRILDDFGIKATFFLVGEKVKAYPAEVRQLAQSGHEIGNHTYTHPDMTALSATEQRRQLKMTCDALSDLGIDATWFRPPYGRAGRVALTLADELGMDVIRWSVDPQDWSEPGVEKIQSRVLQQTVPGGVILLHSTNKQTVAALPGLITELLDRGYTFTTMSDWRAAVTGKTQPTPQAPARRAGSDTATEVTRIYELNDPFYQAYAPYRAIADTGPTALLETPLPAVVTDRSDPAAAAPPEPTTPAVATNRLTVYTNFSHASTINEVRNAGGNWTLYTHAPATSADLPVPDYLTPALLQGGVDVHVAMHQAEPPASAVLAESEEPMPALEVNLELGGQLAGQWIPPDYIASADLDPPPSPTPDGPGGTIPARYFLLVSDNRSGQPAWAGLERLVHQACLDGLVLPTASFFGAPPAGLDCPWTFAGPSRISSLPQLELTTGCIGELLGYLTAGHTNVIVLPPGADTPATAEGVAGLLLLRQLTAGLPLAGNAELDGWVLPAGVQLVRFANDRRQAVVIVNETGAPVELAVPPAFAHFSVATMSAASVRLDPALPERLSVGTQPVFLYYDRDVTR